MSDNKASLYCSRCGSKLLADSRIICRHYANRHRMHLEMYTVNTLIQDAQNAAGHLDSKESIHKITPEIAAELRKILQDRAFFTNKEIEDYLVKNPNKYDAIGKFGVPQDKYRWGFYGSRTMEYDSWRRESTKK